MSVVGSEAGMDARRVDADSSGARDGTARLSVRPLRGVKLRLGEDALWSPVAGDAPEPHRTQLSDVSARPINLLTTSSGGESS